LWAELHRRRAADHELSYFRGLYEAQTDSISWKVTWPLREAKVLAGKAQRRLAR
jgi:hypothetical protein